jgi:uncharacterized protein
MLITEVKSNQWSLSLSGFGELVQGIDDVNQCLYILLLTKKGTVPLDPFFGCGAFDFIDKPINAAGPGIISAVNDAIRLYEPRIDVVKIVPSYNSSGYLNIVIEWKFKNTVKTEQTNINYGLN